jgi:hypothetical protein
MADQHGFGPKRRAALRMVFILFIKKPYQSSRYLYWMMRAVPIK